MRGSDPPPDEKDEAPIKALDEDDIALLTAYGAGPYAAKLKAAEAELKTLAKRVDDACGVRESDTGLAPPSRWDLVSDKQAMSEEQPLQVCERKREHAGVEGERQRIIFFRLMARSMVSARIDCSCDRCIFLFFCSPLLVSFLFLFCTWHDEDRCPRALRRLKKDQKGRSRT